MQSCRSNAERLVAGALRVSSTSLSRVVSSRAAHAVVSGAWIGNGVLVMPSTWTSSMVQPESAVFASAPSRNRT